MGGGSQTQKLRKRNFKKVESSMLLLTLSLNFNEFDANINFDMEASPDKQTETQPREELTPEISPNKENHPNSEPRTSKENNERNSEQVLNLCRYDIVNDKVYLGKGFFVHKDDWDTLRIRKKNSLWIISLAELMWPNGLKNKSLDVKKARPRAVGQKREKLTPEKVKVMENQK